MSDRPAPQSAQAQEQEVAHYDDGVVSSAFKWSGIAAVLLLVAGVAGYVYLNRKPAKRQVHLTKLVTPETRPEAVIEIPKTRFTAITAEAGITFSHVNGAYGEKLLPETMGGGVAFLDFDNDGAQDLLFINSNYWPGKTPAGAQPPTPKLYHNNGHGQFTDVTARSGLDISLYGMGVAVGDYDNDGWPDIFITCVGGNRLFHNEHNGHFKDVTAESGLANSPEDWSTGAAFLDYDNDGRLDLFVCNYVRWSREIDIEVGYKLVGIGRAYGQPMNFAGAFSRLYHNNGDRTFTEVSPQAGIQVRNPATGLPAGKALAVAPVDLDNDGWIDIVVANDGVQNFVFHNQRNGTFKEMGAMSGIAFDNYGKARGAMGIDAGRFRDDDALGIVIANFATEMTALYVAQHSPLQFADESITEGIGPAGLLLLKFGVFFFDYDLDGRLDVLTADGHLEEEISKIQQSQTYRQPAQLFWNAGPGAPAGCFLPVPSERCGQDLFKPMVGRGSAFADIDGDGDLDVVITQVGGAPLLLRNDQALGNHWVRLKLIGSSVNRDAIGAWVKLKVGGTTLWRQVMPTRSYLSQSELPITIGLGPNTSVQEAEVIWPGGKAQAIPPGDIRIGAETRIHEAVK